MSSLIQICTSSLGRKYIMALSGLFLGGFLLVHAAGNSFIFQGPEAFNAYAEHLHSLGLLVPISELLLLALFLLHIITGITLFLDNRKARGQRYAVSETTAGGRSWGSRSMPYTGLIILVFLCLHLLNLRFVVHAVSVADTLIQVLSSPFSTLLYLGGITALTLHLSHGFWSLFQSLGLNHPGYDGLIRRTSYLLNILIIGVFLSVIILLW